MTKYLFKVGFNYADEFDVNDDCIIEDFEIGAINRGAIIASYGEDGEYEYWFGTNESVDLVEIGLDFVEISDTDAEMIERLFPGKAWGTAADIAEQLIEVYVRDEGKTDLSDDIDDDDPEYDTAEFDKKWGLK